MKDFEVFSTIRCVVFNDTHYERPRSVQHSTLSIVFSDTHYEKPRSVQHSMRCIVFSDTLWKTSKYSARYEVQFSMAHIMKDLEAFSTARCIVFNDTHYERPRSVQYGRMYSFQWHKFTLITEQTGQTEKIRMEKDILIFRIILGRHVLPFSPSFL